MRQNRTWVLPVAACDADTRVARSVPIGALQGALNSVLPASGAGGVTPARQGFARLRVCAWSPSVRETRLRSRLPVTGVTPVVLRMARGGRT